ncbi:MAG TPA: YhjD/YihY/BrkB family envelope integrity protein [Gaiella sp.]
MAEPGSPDPRRDRLASVRSRADDLRARAEQTRLELEGRYGDRRPVAVARDVLLLDRAIAGGELAGALAYRLFLWFLPFVLVLVAGLGAYADASSETPEQVARRLGLAGLVVHSVAAAATSNARWYAILIGIPLLLYFTRSLLRSVVAVHRLAWGIEHERGLLTAGNVLLFLVAIVVSLAVAAVVTASVQESVWLWLVVAPVAVLVRCIVWLGCAWRLPALDRSVRTLLPGALVVGVGFLVVNVFTQIAIVWLGDTREDTYGALGLAATILFSLWLTSRVIVLGAVTNAALWSRRPKAPPRGQP